MDSRLPLNIAGTLVAIGLIAILGFVTWALIFVQVPQGNRDTLTVVVGVLSANVGLVVGFFFGSTVTNHRKDSAVAALAEAARPTQPDTLTVLPGQQATATATDAGTVIHKETTDAQQ